jgi:hypothetical protein
VTAPTPIEIRPELGYIALGGLRIALAPDGSDALCVGGTALLRPVSFAERERIVRDALPADDPAAALVAIVAERSILEPGDLDEPFLKLVAMALACGEEPERSFAESARLAVERKGWTWKHLLDLPAWIVERAARNGSSDDGWSTIVFCPSLRDPDDLTLELAGTLLRRSVGLPRTAASTNQPGPLRDGSADQMAAGDRPFSSGRVVPGPETDTRTEQRMRVADAGLRAEPCHLLRQEDLSSVGQGSIGNAFTRARQPTVESGPDAPTLATDDFRPPSATQFNGLQSAAALRFDAGRFPTRVAAARRRESASARWTTAGASARTDVTLPFRVAAPPSFEAGPTALPVVPEPAYDATAHQNVGPKLADADRSSHWMDELASALSAECDLRGIER